MLEFAGSQGTEFSSLFLVLLLKSSCSSYHILILHGEKIQYIDRICGMKYFSSALMLIFPLRDKLALFLILCWQAALRKLSDLSESYGVCTSE